MKHNNKIGMVNRRKLTLNLVRTFPLVALTPLIALLSAEGWKPAESPLTTPWTVQVKADQALPEYPRPQLARRQWTNLNGLWDFAIRPKDENAPEKFEGRILVPFPVESALSGVKRPLTPDQRLWYRRSVKTPKTRGKRLLLHFGAVDWRAEVYVNGKLVGSHEGGYDPFTFDITDQIKPGAPSQQITVAVWDPTDSELHPRGKQVLNPNGIWYTAVSGIWQTVWLEPVPTAYIEKITFTPDVDGRKLRLKVVTEGNGEFTATARLGGRIVGKVMGKAGTDVEIALKDMEVWSPDKPTLYDLDVSLKSGDSVKSYFGMRKIEVRKDSAGFNRLFLNNAATFMIGPLDQGWWPDGLYTAPTDEALKSDIVTLKKLGFNMMRKHVKVEPARFYYWCDKLGLMVWQDMPSAMLTDRKHGVRKGDPDVTFTAGEDSSWRRELQALITNLANVPSIVAWVPFNEGWGQHATNEILKLVKTMDPSRLVDGPSGWEDRGFGDMKDMHQYPGPGMFPVVDDRASVLGEYGGLGIPLDDHLWWNKRNWGYRTFDDRAKIQAAYEDLIDKIGPMAKQGLAAAVYTQTTDVEGEINGLMTYDRKVIKYDAPKLAEIHRRLIGSVR